MKLKVVINRPQTVFDGWTGYIVHPVTGGAVHLTRYCGAGAVSFDSREQIIREAKRVARTLAA